MFIRLATGVRVKSTTIGLQKFLKSFQCSFSCKFDGFQNMHKSQRIFGLLLQENLVDPVLYIMADST